jgi:hypothetical protein
MCRLFESSGCLNLLEPYGHVQACTGIALPSYKHLDIVADIKKKRLEWTGHVVRMDHGSVVKIFESKPEGRRMGRPRQKRLEYVEKDQREMKVKIWRQKAVDTEEMASVIKEAKVLRGP